MGEYFTFDAASRVSGGGADEVLFGESRRVKGSKAKVKQELESASMCSRKSEP